MYVGKPSELRLEFLFRSHAQGLLFRRLGIFFLPLMIDKWSLSSLYTIITASGSREPNHSVPTTSGTKLCASWSDTPESQRLSGSSTRDRGLSKGILSIDEATVPIGRCGLLKQLDDVPRK